MDPLMPVAAIISSRATAHDALSARPHAPVVPDDVPRPARAPRTRRVLAAALDRAARAVEPAPRCSPSH